MHRIIRFRCNNVLNRRVFHNSSINKNDIKNDNKMKEVFKDDNPAEITQDREWNDVKKIIKFNLNPPSLSTLYPGLQLQALSYQHKNSNNPVIINSNASSSSHPHHHHHHLNEPGPAVNTSTDINTANTSKTTSSSHRGITIYRDTFNDIVF